MKHLKTVYATEDDSIKAMNIDSVSKSLILAFRARYLSIFNSQETAYNKCKFVSYELLKAFQAQGLDSVKLVHIEDCKREFERPHPKWQKEPFKEWTHYVLRIDKYYVDFTAKQFDESLPVPTIGLISELKRDWKIVEDDDFITSIATQFVNMESSNAAVNV